MPNATAATRSTLTCCRRYEQCCSPSTVHYLLRGERDPVAGEQAQLNVARQPHREAHREARLLEAQPMGRDPSERVAAGAVPRCARQVQGVELRRGREGDREGGAAGRRRRR